MPVNISFPNPSPAVKSPAWRREWTWLLLAALCAYALALAPRLVEAERWSGQDYRIAGERVMATPDAYYWLAGAAGSGRGVGTPPALLAAAAAKWFSVGLDAVCFWAPPLLASLVAPATLLWAWTLWGPAGATAARLAASLAAGLLAALAPAYYYRTRLGYYDTDMLVLFAPLLVSWSVAQGLASLLEPRASADASPLPSFLWMTAAGLGARLCAPWHAQLPAFHVVTAGLALTLALTLGQSKITPERRLEGLCAVALFSICALLGWPGAAGAASFLLATRLGLLRRLFALRLGWRGATLLLVATFAGLALSGAITDFAREAALFLQRAVSKSSSILSPHMASDPAAMRYPDMTQSIEEAQAGSLAQFLTLLHPWAGVALTGLAGFAALVFRRPQALLLAPLLGLGLACFWLGQRTAMFAAPAMALGLCLPCAWYLQPALRELLPEPKKCAAAAVWLLLAGAAALLAPLALRYQNLALTPALSKEHGEALAALGRIAPPGGRVWTWWDFGYAAQYFARLAPVADGGRQGPEYVYLVGKVLTTDNALQAQQLMRFAAAHSYTPWLHWSQSTTADHTTFLAQLQESDCVQPPADKQYLVIAADTLRIAPRVLEYGSWDPAARQSRTPYCVSLLEAPVIDGDSGILENADRAVPGANSQTIELDGLYRATRGHLEWYAFNERSGLKLMSLPDADVRLLMDARAWRSLLVQMLIHPANAPRFEPWFKLVYDDAPFVRVFEVR